MKENMDKIGVLFRRLVPTSGKADTVAGEIVRAVNRICYRWYNDGDMIGAGYGKETCNPAARYLTKRAGSRVERVISDMWGIYISDCVYEERLETLCEEVLTYLEAHPELEKTENTEDMWDYYDREEDVDDSEDEDDEW